MDQTSASSPNMEKIVIGVFSGMSALMTLICVISAFSVIQKISKEETVSGIVVDVTARREYVTEQDRFISDFYYPVIEFTARDGDTRTVQINEGSETPAYANGDEITVAYDPEHPQEARIKSAGSTLLMWILPGITGILGVAFAGAVWVAKIVMSA